MALIQAPHTDSFGKRFSNTFIPQITKGFERYAEEETEKRKAKTKTLAETAKEERELQRNRRNAKALLGREDLDLDSSAIASIYKEQEKNARNDELMKFLGISPPSQEGEAPSATMQSLGNQPAPSQMNAQQQTIGGNQPPSKGRFNLLEVPDQAIAAISLRNPALANTIQQAKKQALDERVRQEEAVTKKRERAEDIERKPLEKAAESYFNRIEEYRDEIPTLRLATDTMQNAINSKDIGFFSSPHLARIAQAFGAPADIVKGLENPASKSFESSRKFLFGKGLNDLFKGTTSGRQIGLVEGMLAEIGANEAANQATAFVGDAILMLKEEEVKLFKEAQSKGISNYKIRDYVDMQLDPYREQLSKHLLEAINALREQ